MKGQCGSFVLFSHVFILFSFVDCGQQCLSCKNIQNIGDCHNRVTCSNNEVCFQTRLDLTTGESKYNLGCGFSITCGQFDASVRGDLLDVDGLYQMCSVCCNETRLCNRDVNCDNSSTIDIDFLPRECGEIKNVTTGVHRIYPNGDLPSIQVYCFVEEGNAWTVFQRRTSGCLDFYRDWQSYKTGFGDADGEYWLGNKHLHEITSHGRHGLHVQLSDFDDNHGYANYSTFSLGDERSGYQLIVTKYTGNIGDSLTYHSGMSFSTKDRDNDLSNEKHIAVSRAGAWWYTDGYQSNLNGRYLRGIYKPSIIDYKGMNWDSWKGSNYSVKSTIMMTRSY